MTIHPCHSPEHRGLPVVHFLGVRAMQQLENADIVDMIVGQRQLVPELRQDGWQHLGWLGERGRVLERNGWLIVCGMTLSIWAVLRCSGGVVYLMGCHDEINV